MSFIDIPTLNGGHVLVDPGSVYRIMRNLPGDGAGAVSHVDFDGGLQLTSMPQAAVAALVTNAGHKLVVLTAPDGSQVFLAIEEIAAIRAADPHSDPASANAVLTVSGQRQSVKETQQQVQQAIAALG
jgi:hypothetical protein